jgi:ankyrin repeat protein
VVKLLLDTGKEDADSKDRGGGTPLWLAAANGREAVVKLLLETGKVGLLAGLA